MSNLTAEGFLRKRGTIWVSFLALWLALGVFTAGTVLVELPPLRRIGPPPTGSLSIQWRMFWYQLAVWVAWVVLAPAALWLRRRWPLELGSLKRALPVHAAAVVLLCAAHSVLVLMANWLIMQPGHSLAEMQFNVLLVYWWLRDLPFAALFYALILGIGSALDYYRRFRERQLRASR